MAGIDIEAVMAEPISSIRMREIDYILRHPNKFTKPDVHAAAVELRAEVERLLREHKPGPPLHALRRADGQIVHGDADRGKTAEA